MTDMTLIDAPVAVTTGRIASEKNFNWWDLETGDMLATISFEHTRPAGRVVIQDTCPNDIALEVVQARANAHGGAWPTVTHKVTSWPRADMPIKFEEIGEQE